MGQALPFCVECEDKRGCDSCTDLHNWIMEHMETKRADQASGDAISRDALLKDGIRVEYGYNDNGLLMIPMRDVRKSIKNAPAIDAVQVVRCRDCRWRNTGACPIDNPADDGFCHGGETEEAWNRRFNHAVD